jgi:uncharacterized protein YdeI (YjbR/CyaY-like superfamily)
VVKAPPDLDQALKQHPQAETALHQLPYTHQKEYVRWIEGSKREATRKSPITRTIEMLEQGKKTR